MFAHSKQDPFGLKNAKIQLDKIDDFSVNMSIVVVKWKRPLIKLIYMGQECPEEIVTKALLSADNDTLFDSKEFIDYCCHGYRKNLFLMVFSVVLYACLVYQTSLPDSIGRFLDDHYQVIIGINCGLFTFGGIVACFLYNRYSYKSNGECINEMEPNKPYAAQIVKTGQSENILKRSTNIIDMNTNTYQGELRKKSSKEGQLTAANDEIFLREHRDAKTHGYNLRKRTRVQDEFNKKNIPVRERARKDVMHMSRSKTDQEVFLNDRGCPVQQTGCKEGSLKKTMCTDSGVLLFPSIDSFLGQNSSKTAVRKRTPMATELGHGIQHTKEESGHHLKKLRSNDCVDSLKNLNEKETTQKIAFTYKEATKQQEKNEKQSRTFQTPEVLQCFQDFLMSKLNKCCSKYLDHNYTFLVRTSEIVYIYIFLFATLLDKKFPD